MKQHRCLTDFIILTTIPHIFTLSYTMHDFCYTAIMSMTTLSSIWWHQTHETSKKLLILDYSFAGLLCGYELYQSTDKLYVLQLNLGILVINKFMDILSKYSILKYNKGHCIYHVLSCYKTYYIAREIYLKR